MRSDTVPVAAALILFAASTAVAEPRPPACAESAFYALPQRPYVAFRRLEAENPKTGRQAWMDVRTAVGADGVLVVDILAEGGSEQIRNRVFRAALERERTLLAKRPSAHAMGDGDAYECSDTRARRVGASPHSSQARAERRRQPRRRPHVPAAVNRRCRARGWPAGKKPLVLGFSCRRRVVLRTRPQRCRPARVAAVDGEAENIRTLHVPHDLRLSERGWPAGIEQYPCIQTLADSYGRPGDREEFDPRF